MKHLILCLLAAAAHAQVPEGFYQSGRDSNARIHLRVVSSGEHVPTIYTEPLVEMAVDPIRYGELMTRLQTLALEHPRAASWGPLMGGAKSPAWSLIASARAFCGPGERNGSVSLVRFRDPVAAERDPKNPARPVYDPDHPERTQTSDLVVNVPITPTERDCKRLIDLASAAIESEGVADAVGSFEVSIETMPAEGIVTKKIDGLLYVVAGSLDPSVVIVKGYAD